LIRDQLPPPSDYGLEAGARLEIWTEFMESPTPAISTRLLKPAAVAPDAKVLDPQFSDNTLDFGAVRISLGTAFPLTEASVDSVDEPPVLVAKEWTTIDQRQFLIEKVDLADAAVQLAKLPKTAAVRRPASQPSGTGPALQNQPGTVRQSLLAGQAEASTTNGTPAPRNRSEVLLSASKSAAGKRRPAGTPQDRASLKEQASAQPNRSIPSQKAWTPDQGIQVAHISKPEPGFSIDYSTVISQTNFTFKGDTTYFVAAQVNLAGTTILEGGCVIKATNGGSSQRIVLQGPLDCRTSPYRPAILTGNSDTPSVRTSLVPRAIRRQIIAVFFSA